MKLDRFRAPVLAAAAVLMISGAGIAFAGNPSTVAPARIVPAAQTEPTGPETDTLQQGDQTTPDVPGAGSPAKHAAAAVSTTKAALKATTETSSDGSEGSGAVGTEADGPGGHADPAGQNVDHQFNGQE